MNLAITAPLILILLSTPLLAYGGLNCSEGAYVGRDNAGNKICKTIGTNEIVDSNSGSFTIGGEEIGGNAIIFGIIFFIIIIVIMIKVFGGGGGKTESSHNQGNAAQNNIYQHQQAAKKIQEHLCAVCGKEPNHWQFRPIRDRETGRVLGLQGLCLDCA